MNMIPVTSSNIRSIGYHNRILQIEFTSGGTYQYLDVPEDVFNEFLMSNSKGRFFHARIKPAFMFVKLESAA